MACAHEHPEWAQLPWRTGMSVGRTVCVQFGAKPAKSDGLIGMFDTRELAQAAVDAHNAALTDR